LTETQTGQGVSESGLESVARSVALLLEKSPDLAVIVDAWPNVPEAERKAVLSIVRQAAVTVRSDRRRLRGQQA